MLRAALRFGFGTASLLAGSWVARALHGAPAALGGFVVAAGTPTLYREVLDTIG